VFGIGRVCHIASGAALRRRVGSDAEGGADAPPRRPLHPLLVEQNAITASAPDDLVPAYATTIGPASPRGRPHHRRRGRLPGARMQWQGMYGMTC